MVAGLVLAGAPIDRAIGPDGSSLALAAGARQAPGNAQQAPGRAQQAQQRAPLTLQAQAASAITWDFETGDLRGWTASGTAFNAQPTLGDNSRARGSQPANQQGDFWVGTFENHPRGSERAGTAQGDRPQGTLSSTAFNVPAGTLSFLVGGGSSFETRVELRVFDSIEGAIRVAFASGNNSETMRRQTWELGRWTGQRAQIWIVDESSGPWGHINVDDFRFSATAGQQPTRPITPPQQELEVSPQVARTRVPDLVGRDLDSAREMLVQVRLELGDVRREPSLRPVGIILQQSPQASTVVGVGTAVSISVAAPVPGGNRGENRPPDLVTVPDVVGRDARAALDILKAGRLEGRIVDRREAPQPVGTVVTQAPPAGDRVAPASVVELTEAVPVMAIVPSLFGRSEEAARRALADANLTVGRVGRQQSTEPSGSVLTQGVEAGTQVQQGSPIDFDVAVPVMRTVPDLIGQPQQSARRLLEAADLRVGNVSSEESRDDPGVVLDQSVAAGTSVVLGAVVDVVVSEPMRVSVPDLIEQPEPEARRRLEAAELVVGTVTETESRREPGIVVTQSERAGSRVVLGTAVDLVVTTPVTVAVPDLLGRSEQAARGLLEGVELQLGNVAQRESREPVGNVLSQQPPAGARVQVDATVDLVVAAPVTVLVPNVGGRSEAEARQQLADYELGIGSAARRESRERTGTVLEQSIEPGTRVAVGTALDLVLADPVRVAVPEVIGSSEADAEAAITAVELVVGEVLYQESAALPGTVLTQSLNPGTLVQIGSTVNLLVAVIETVAVPEVTGRPVEEARRQLVTGRLTVGTEELRETRVEPEGTVMEQSRRAGTAVEVGTAINLIVATPEVVIVPSVIGLAEEEARAVIIGAGLVVGAVAEGLSIQAGGTVLEQGQPVGSQVVFGTPVALQVARDRFVWAAPTGLLLLVVVIGAMVALRGTKKRSRPPRPKVDEQPAEKAPSAEVRVRAVADPGTQTMDTDADHGHGTEIRLRPRVDCGHQEIHSPGELIDGERKEGERQEDE